MVFYNIDVKLWIGVIYPLAKSLELTQLPLLTRFETLPAARNT